MAMKMKSEFEAFSKRLRRALKHKQIAGDPIQLANDFNARFPALAVSGEETGQWLNAQAMPTQKRILALAGWLGVTHTWLRFGVEAEPGTPAVPYSDEELVARYRGLSETHRATISEIILSLVPEWPESKNS